MTLGVSYLRHMVNIIEIDEARNWEARTFVGYYWGY